MARKTLEFLIERLLSQAGELVEVRQEKDENLRNFRELKDELRRAQVTLFQAEKQLEGVKVFANLAASRGDALNELEGKLGLMKAWMQQAEAFLTNGVPGDVSLEDFSLQGNKISEGFGLPADLLLNHSRSFALHAWEALFGMMTGRLLDNTQLGALVKEGERLGLRQLSEERTDPEALEEEPETT